MFQMIPECPVNCLGCREGPAGMLCDACADGSSLTAEGVCQREYIHVVIRLLAVRDFTPEVC